MIRTKKGIITEYNRANDVILKISSADCGKIINFTFSIKLFHVYKRKHF